MAIRKSFNVSSVHARDRIYSTIVTITAAGAILSQTGTAKSGLFAVKNAAAGRYDFTYDGGRTFALVKGGYCNMIKGDAAAFPTTTGADPQFRTLTTSAATVQFLRQDTQADADAASGVAFAVIIILSTSP